MSSREKNIKWNGFFERAAPGETDYLCAMKLKTIKTVLNHPLNAGRPLSALCRLFKRGLVVRLHRSPIAYPFVENTFLVVEQGMSSAELQIYTHLYDFREMAFLLHYMRKEEDVFVDIGANIGVYTVFAAGLAEVRVIAAEPAPGTFRKLERNVLFNGLQKNTELHNVAVGDENGYLDFTSGLDAVNHVVLNGEGKNTVKVPAVTLDHLLADKEATCLKIDVEGFEANVINGASSVLSRDSLQVVIMETNGLSDLYSFGQNYLHDKLVSFGFSPCAYDPFLRKIIILEQPDDTNTIYIKNVEAAVTRVREGRRFSVGGWKF